MFSRPKGTASATVLRILFWSTTWLDHTIDCIVISSGFMTFYVSFLLTCRNFSWLFRMNRATWQQVHLKNYPWKWADVAAAATRWLKQVRTAISRKIDSHSFIFHLPLNYYLFNTNQPILRNALWFAVRFLSLPSSSFKCYCVAVLWQYMILLKFFIFKPIFLCCCTFLNSTLPSAIRRRNKWCAAGQNEIGEHDEIINGIAFCSPSCVHTWIGQYGNAK